MRGHGEETQSSSSGFEKLSPIEWFPGFHGVSFGAWGLIMVIPFLMGAC